MVRPQQLDRLISKAAWGRGSWEHVAVDVATVARRQRVAHVVEELKRLGHDQLAHDLVVREHGDSAEAPRKNITPAA